MKGKFIVLEGPDRCGKSTQAKMLFNTLLEQAKNEFDWVLLLVPYMLS